MREYQNKSLEKALSILDCFTREQRELTSSEIAKKLRLNLSSIYPLLSTLEKYKYITRKENGKYSLGINLIVKGNLVLSGLNLIEIARVPLQRLAHEYHGNVHLAILNNWKALIVDRSLASDRVFINSIIGYEIPLYCTSLGRALLAFLDPEEIEEYFEIAEFKKFTPTTLTDKEKLRKELKEIKLRGYAINDEEFTPGEISFAAPVFNSQGKVVASINLALNKLSKLLNYENYYLRVIQIAKEISSFLGYMGTVAG
ncbi:MAG: IclR family transcriptional regulator [Thermotogaceae bacterium]|nr:IclR family transcriptional regulator [Thermotogaceae bacterium]